MAFNFLNFGMLLGMLGLLLPIIAHLISKRKFDVVSWGAMQFLELGKRTRRRIRLEEWLLLLVRMGLIALLVLAFARPWAKGGVFANFLSSHHRDIVIVLDGSYSMGWEGEAETPWEAAIDKVHHVLESLSSGDKVSLIDARSQPRWIVDPPTHDFRYVREKLAELPPPAGTTNLPSAVGDALQILSRTTNLQREVIVITDGQQQGWDVDNTPAWQRLDDLREQPSVKPSIRCFQVGKPNVDKTNFVIDPIVLSRETTVPDFPVRIKARIRQIGGSGAVLRKVYFELDGQRRADKTVQLRILPDGEATVEFEHRFLKPGSHLVSVLLDADPLPGDNRSDAVVVVQKGIPVLIVDGDPQSDETLSESYFVNIGLQLSLKEEPWFQVKTISWLELENEPFTPYEVILFANVPRFNEQTATRIREFVATGHGVVFAPGDKVQLKTYAVFQENVASSTKGSVKDSVKSKSKSKRKKEKKDIFLPARFEKRASQEKQANPANGVDANGVNEGADEDRFDNVRILKESLKADWLQRFRDKRSVDLLTTRFTDWWKLSPIESQSSGDVVVKAPVVIAQMNTADPFLIQRTYGEGRVFMMSVPLDADWTSLPAKNDFLPFLHEMMFSLTNWRTQRNVDSGSELMFMVPGATQPENWVFYNPEGKLASATTRTIAKTSKKVFVKKKKTANSTPSSEASTYALVVNNTALPGVYRCENKKSAKTEEVKPKETLMQFQNNNDALFVVNFDRNESDLSSLTDISREAISKNDRIDFLDSIDDLKERFAGEDSGTELWRWLLFLFLGFLLFELWMTNRLVRGGHETTDGEITDENMIDQSMTEENTEENTEEAKI